MTLCSVLHVFVFKNDYEGLQSNLQVSSDSIEEKFRGQTPLTLGHKECIEILLNAGASCVNKTDFGWTPFQEATSFGNREIMKMIHLLKRKKYSEWVDTQGCKLLNDLSADLQDVEFEMCWSFSSIIPFVSLLCPSDTYKIYKRGNNVRIDTTLVGFEKLSWIRGNVSIIFDGNRSSPRLVICDHDTKVVQQIWPKDFTISNEAVEEDINVALNTPIHATPALNLETFLATRAKSGIFGFRYDQSEVIEGFPTSVWNIGSIRIDSPERIEHLNVEPLPLFKISELKRKEKELLKLQKSKAKQTSRFVIANPDNSSSEDEDSTFQKQEKVEEEMIRNYKSGYRNFEDFEDQSDWKEAKKAYNELLAFRPSLEPPKHHSFTFEDYFKSDDPLHLGRNFDVVDSNREFSAKMWIYEPLGDPDTDLDVIPFRPDSLYPLFGLLGAGNEHFRSFTDFLQVKAPKGFPVQIEIPIGILPLSAKVKFQNIMRKCEKGDGWFQIPTEDDGYRAGEVVKDSVYE